MPKEKKTAEEIMDELDKKDPKKQEKINKDIGKAEAKTKKEKAPKPEVASKDLKQAIKENKIGEDIKWVPRTKRIALKFKGISVFYVHDSPHGIHYFKRKKGTRLDSGYIATRSEMDAFVKKFVTEVQELKKQFEAETKEIKE